MKNKDRENAPKTRAVLRKVIGICILAAAATYFIPELQDKISSNAEFLKRNGGKHND